MAVIESPAASAIRLIGLPWRPRGLRLAPSTSVSVGLALAICLIALLVPLLHLQDPVAGALQHRLLPPGSPGHPLGTDGQGRDLLSRLLWGLRPSLLSGLLPVAVAAIAGSALGLLAGLAGHRLHEAVMRVLDVFYAFPAVLLAIAIAAALGSGLSNAIIALSIILVPPIARIAETETARLRNADFMTAARASGASWLAIVGRQVLPNVAPGIVVYCSSLIGLSIIYAAGLSFLGLGVSPPTPELGLMVNDLRQFIFTSPVLLLEPAVEILAVAVIFNVLGDSLRRLLDHRMEAI
jgi:peptide/nickel transport system permease protein